MDDPYAHFVTGLLALAGPSLPPGPEVEYVGPAWAQFDGRAGERFVRVYLYRVIGTELDKIRETLAAAREQITRGRYALLGGRQVQVTDVAYDLTTQAAVMVTIATPGIEVVLEPLDSNTGRCLVEAGRTRSFSGPVRFEAD